MKDCGGCRHFVKTKSISVPGLCEKKDSQTKSDYGSKFSEWKGKKYKRNLVKPRSPRYDDVFFEGLEWLNTL